MEHEVLMATDIVVFVQHVQYAIDGGTRIDVITMLRIVMGAEVTNCQVVIMFRTNTTNSNRYSADKEQNCAEEVSFLELQRFSLLPISLFRIVY